MMAINCLISFAMLSRISMLLDSGLKLVPRTMSLTSKSYLRLKDSSESHFSRKSLTISNRSDLTDMHKSVHSWDEQCSLFFGLEM